VRAFNEKLRVLKTLNGFVSKSKGFVENLAYGLKKN